MIYEVRAVAPFHKNGFVIGCERTHEAVVIDPGDEAGDLLAAVRDSDVQVTHILLTHAHIDHITGVAQVKDALAVPVYLHKDDLPLYEHAVQQGQMFGFAVRQPPPVDAYYDLNPIYFGDYEVRVHHTPGHCPGACVFRSAGRAPPARIYSSETRCLRDRSAVLTCLVAITKC